MSAFSMTTEIRQPCKMPLVARNSLPMPPPILKRRRKLAHLALIGASMRSLIPIFPTSSSKMPCGMRS
eukprot:634124-Karenia_brevis.AAC.1